MSLAKLKLRWASHGGSDYAAIVALRREVLRKPLGLDYSADQLAAETGQFHLGIWDGQRLIGCLALKELGGGGFQMRQVAVAEEFRGSGVGRLLALEAEAEARRRGAKTMVLHSRQTAVAFYERLGYAAEGPVYLEIGLPHHTMSKAL